MRVKTGRKQKLATPIPRFSSSRAGGEAVARETREMTSWKSRRVLLLLLLRRRRARRNSSRNRSVGVRSIFRRRQQQGEYHNLLQELRLCDPDSHFKYMRMSRQVFDKLVEKVSSILSGTSPD